MPTWLKRLLIVWLLVLALAVAALAWLGVDPEPPGFERRNWRPATRGE